MNIETVLNNGINYLKINKVKTSRIDSEILMSKAIKKEREYVLLNLDKEIDERNIIHFYDLIKTRSKGKPIAYLVGKKEFWKYEFKISEKVLIPRPDTELIVDQALKIVQYKSNLKVLDIGVGSGCILLSILKEKKSFFGTGIDVSKESINISRINSIKLGLENRIKFFKSDIDNFNYGKYDLIISNPPYINKQRIKYLERDVREFEPKSALNGGIDGLSEIRKVIKKTSELIKKNGIFILEIAFDQKNRVKEILKNRGFYIERILKDYADNDRCIVCKKA